MTMFSLMTALLSPKVLDTLSTRKEVLFQALEERAGVLCVQPSSGICMLQGEWECMKKAYTVLEEFCLQVQAQTTVHAMLELRAKYGYTNEDMYSRMGQDFANDINASSQMENSSMLQSDYARPNVAERQDLTGERDVIIHNHERSHVPQVDDMLDHQQRAPSQPPPQLHPAVSLESPSPNNLMRMIPESYLEREVTGSQYRPQTDMHDPGHSVIHQRDEEMPHLQPQTDPKKEPKAINDAIDDDNDSEGALRIALSEDENAFSGSESNDDPHSIRRVIHSRANQSPALSGDYVNKVYEQAPDLSEAVSVVPAGYNDGTAAATTGRVADASSLDVKPIPDLSQLRVTLAHMYAMQHSVLNYGHYARAFQGMSEQDMSARMLSPTYQYTQFHLPQNPSSQVPVKDQQIPTTSAMRPTPIPPVSTYNPGPTDLSMSTRRKSDELDIKREEEDKRHVHNIMVAQGKEAQGSGQRYSQATNEDSDDEDVHDQSQQRLPGMNEWAAAIRSTISANAGAATDLGQQQQQQQQQLQQQPTQQQQQQQPANTIHCPACMATFPSRETVQEHMLQAHAVGPGLQGQEKQQVPPSPAAAAPPQLSADACCCPICGKFYKSGQRLREHILLHDKNYQRPQYPCPACGKTFTYRHNMKVHFQKIHKGKQPPKRHECNICGQKFHKPVYLRHHLLRHKEALYGGIGGGGGDPGALGALPGSSGHSPEDMEMPGNHNMPGQSSDPTTT